MPVRYLVVASETPDQRDARRKEVGASSDETFSQTLEALRPGSSIDRLSCVDRRPLPPSSDFRSYEVVFFAGSPISMHEDTAATREAAAFMRQVFASGVPSFGSCAGLQIATVAAGGSTRPREPGIEAAFARGIVATAVGRSHPLLCGRPLTWDAPAMHSDQVSELPASGIVLAQTTTTAVQAAEFRHAGGVFWGGQYHPELTLDEIAAAIRRQSDDLIEQDLARDASAFSRHAARIDALDSEPERRDLAWQLGLDEQVTDPRRRMIEIRKFMEAAVELRTGGMPSGMEGVLRG